MSGDPIVVEFGKLENVDLRTVWPREDRDFTPWLSENLDRLSEVIGIPLEPEGIEVTVEQFYADVLARNPQDNSLVLIENQLEWTDHTHLGQVLTYLAGLEAQTVVWVAKEFTSAHLSAIRWLNEHTVDPFAFFAVRVKVVKIGDSALVPILEVLEQPNEWDRQVRSRQEISGELSEMSKLRHDFWAEYTKRHPEDGHIRSTYKAANIYRRIEGIVVSLYIAQSEVGIYMRGNDNRYTDEDRQLAIRCAAALAASDIERSKNFDIRNQANWPAMVEWLHSRFLEYRSVIESVAADPDPEPGSSVHSGAEPESTELGNVRHI